MAMIKYNEKATETTTVSIRSVNVELWKAFKKLAALEEKTLKQLVEDLVKAEIEKVNQEL